jgi:uncharacterized membrane protein
MTRSNHERTHADSRSDSPTEAAAAESPLRRAKRPRSILAGPYGHPFHALAVTLPIGAWTSSLVFDVLALFGVEPDAFSLTAQWLIGIGLVGALLAATFGLLDLATLARGTRARRIALVHLAFNTVAILLFAISMIIRLSQPEQVSVAGFVISVVALLCVGFSGFLGGELVYRYGVRVADEQTQQRGY